LGDKDDKTVDSQMVSGDLPPRYPCEGVLYGADCLEPPAPARQEAKMFVETFPPQNPSPSVKKLSAVYRGGDVHRPMSVAPAENLVHGFGHGRSSM
jgi:hypothetical protein